MATDKRAIGYIRVSTQEQATEGASLAAQRAKIEAYAGLYGLQLVEVIEDAGFSAKDLNRPGMVRLLDLVDRRQVAAVIVLKLDRLTRSVGDLAGLLERFTRRGVDLTSVEEKLDTGTAGGRLVLNIMATVSQWEREVIGERTRTALQHKRATGQKFNGTAPYGWKFDGAEMLPEPSEQELRQVAKTLREKGASLRKIAAELETRGFVNRNGSRRWAAKTVAAIVQA